MINLQTIETRDLLLAAAIFSGRGLQRPAGYCALELLRRLPSSNPETDNDLQAELGSLVGPEPGYLPGFIQKRIRKLVGALRNRADSVPIPDPPGEDDWARLERLFGESISRLRDESGNLSLVPQDFRNLFELRPTIQVWAAAFETRLRQDGHRVWLDSISRVNQTSGYIWVAFRTDPRLKKVEQPTYSMTFTPLGIRAGLVLGGRTRQPRTRFYRLLAEGGLDDILAKLEEPGCALIDIAWYSTIREAVSLRDYRLLPDCRESVRTKAAEAETRTDQESLFSWELAIPALLIHAAEFSPETAESLDNRLRNLAGPILELIARITAQ